MTVLAVRVTVENVSETQRLHSERRDLRESFGCTNARLIPDKSVPNRILVLMEFPSIRHAKTYLSATVLMLGADKLAGVTDRTVEFFERVSLADLEAVPPDDVASGFASPSY